MDASFFRHAPATFDSQMEVYAKVFPPGVVNFISGAGRTTMPPIMASGKVDIFAFIGGSNAADALLKQHPQPHRLKACLALDAKNLCVVAEDCDLDLHQGDDCYL